MAEEHGFQASEGHRLCVNNCGFFGSPATKNMCSKCYEKSGDSSPKVSTTAFPAPPSLSVAVVQTREVTTEAPTLSQPPTNRCFSCRKKVGLMGFRCRCGTTFCGIHRYPEKHECSFDFKAVGREAIAKANPVIRAGRLEKM